MMNNFSFCHFSRFFCCQSSSFDGSRDLFGCSNLLGKYRCHQHQHNFNQNYRQQNGPGGNLCFSSEDIITNNFRTSPPEQIGFEDNNNQITNCSTTTTTFYQPRSTTTSVSAPYYYGDIITSTAYHHHLQNHQPSFNSYLQAQRTPVTYNNHHQNGNGGFLPAIMDGLRVQLKNVRNGGGNSGGSSGIVSGLASRSSKSGTTFGGSHHLRSPNVQRSAEFTVSLRGWLYRLEGAALKQWKRRWCVLTDYCLFYYKDINEEKKLGSVLLPSYRISPCFATSDGISRRHAFKAEHNNMKTYYFAADSKEMQQQWMNALSLASIMQLSALCPQMQLQQTTAKNVSPKTPANSSKTVSTAASPASKNNSSITTNNLLPKTSSANIHAQQQPFFFQEQSLPNTGNRAISSELDESGFLAYEEAKQLQQQQQLLYAYHNSNNYGKYAQQLTPTSSNSLNLFNSVGLPTVFTGEEANSILHAFAPPKPQRVPQNQQQQYYEDAMLTYDHLPVQQGSSSSSLSYNGGAIGENGSIANSAQATAAVGYYFPTATGYDENQFYRNENGNHFFGVSGGEGELPSAYLQHRLPPRPHSADFLERDDQDDEDDGEGDFDEECQNAFTSSAKDEDQKKNGSFFGQTPKTLSAISNTSTILPSRPKSSMARYGPMLNNTSNGNTRRQFLYLQNLQNEKKPYLGTSGVTAAPQILSQTSYGRHALYGGTVNGNVGNYSPAAGVGNGVQVPPLRPPLPPEYGGDLGPSVGLSSRHAKPKVVSEKRAAEMANYYATTSEDETCLTSRTTTTEDGLTEMSKEDMYKASQLFFQRQYSLLSNASTNDCSSVDVSLCSTGSKKGQKLLPGKQQQNEDLNRKQNALTADWNDVGLPQLPSQLSIGSSRSTVVDKDISSSLNSQGRVKAAKMMIESATSGLALEKLSNNSCNSSLQSFTMSNTATTTTENPLEEVKFKLSSKVRTYKKPKNSNGGGSITGTSDTSSDIIPSTVINGSINGSISSGLQSICSGGSGLALTTTNNVPNKNEDLKTTSTSISNSNLNSLTSTSTSTSAPYYYSDLLSEEQKKQLQQKLGNFASPPPLLSRTTALNSSAARLLGMTTLQGCKVQPAISTSAVSKSTSKATAIVGVEEKKQPFELPSSTKTNQSDSKVSSEEQKNEIKSKVEVEQEEVDNECNEKRLEMMKMEKQEKEVTIDEKLITSPPATLVNGGEEVQHIYENYLDYQEMKAQQTPSLDIFEDQKEVLTPNPIDPNLQTTTFGGSSRHIASSSTSSTGSRKRRVKRKSKEDQQNNVSDSEIATGKGPDRHYYKKNSSGAKLSKSSRLCFSAATGLELGGSGKQSEEELTLLLLQLRRRQAELVSSADRLRLAMESEATMAELEPHRAAEYRSRTVQLRERLEAVEREYERQLPTIASVDGLIKKVGKSSKSKTALKSSSKILSATTKKASSMSMLLDRDDERYFDDQLLFNGDEEEVNSEGQEEKEAEAISTVRRQLSDLQLASELPISISGSSLEQSSSVTAADDNLEHLRRQQTALAGELDRVRGMLTHSTRRLEEKAVENAQMEQEMRLARSKLKQVLATEQEVAELSRSSKLAAELAHINTEIDNLHSRRQQLNRAIEGLKCSPVKSENDDFQKKEFQNNGGLSTDAVFPAKQNLHFLQNSNFQLSSPESENNSVPLYENIGTTTSTLHRVEADEEDEMGLPVVGRVLFDQVNNNSNTLLQNNLESPDDLGDLENDEFFTLNINLASKQYDGNKFTLNNMDSNKMTGNSALSATSSSEINNNDSGSHNLNGGNSASSSTMCEFDPTKDMINHHQLTYGSDGSIIDQQIRQIYNYNNQVISGQQATGAGKPAEIRTVREVKREAERRKIQQQQQLNYQNKISQLYGRNFQASSDQQRSVIVNGNQQPNYYLLAANHYYTPESTSNYTSDLEPQPLSSIIAPNGEEFDVLPAYDARRAQILSQLSQGKYTSTLSSRDDDDDLLNTTTMTPTAAPDIVQSTIKYAGDDQMSFYEQ